MANLAGNSSGAAPAAPAPAPAVPVSASSIAYSNRSTALVVCVECGHPMAYIYKEYSRGNIRLSRCRKCRQTGDKYVEWETVLCFIDMVLLKLSVYRHLLFNRPQHSAHRGAGAPGLPSAAKMAVTLLALDTYARLYTKARTVVDEEEAAAAAAAAAASKQAASASAASVAGQGHSTAGSAAGAHLLPLCPSDSFDMDGDGDGDCDAGELTVADGSCYGGGRGYQVDLLRQHSSLQSIYASASSSGGSGSGGGRPLGGGGGGGGGSRMRLKGRGSEMLPRDLYDLSAATAYWWAPSLGFGSGSGLGSLGGSATGSGSGSGGASGSGSGSGGPGAGPTTFASVLSSVLASAGVTTPAPAPTASASSGSGAASVAVDASGAVAVPAAEGEGAGAGAGAGAAPEVDAAPAPAAVSEEQPCRTAAGGVSSYNATEYPHWPPASAAATAMSAPSLASLLPFATAAHGPAPPVDVAERIWALPDLSAAAGRYAGASGVEALALVAGACCAARLAGALSRSRSRCDPLTGLPRIAAPRSRRSMSMNPAAPGGSGSGVTSPAHGLPAYSYGSPSGGGGGGAPGTSGAAAASAAASASSASSNGQDARALVQQLQSKQMQVLSTPEAASRQSSSGHSDEAAPASLVSPPPSSTPAATSTGADSTTAPRSGGKAAPPSPGVPVLLQRAAAWLHLPAPLSAALVAVWGPSRSIVDPSPPTLAEYQHIINALLVSSFAKVFVTLTLVWPYPPAFLPALSAFVLVSHVAAVEAAADCSVAVAALVVAAGWGLQLLARALLVWAGALDAFYLL